MRSRFIVYHFCPLVFTDVNKSDSLQTISRFLMWWSFKNINWLPQVVSRFRQNITTVQKRTNSIISSTVLLYIIVDPLLELLSCYYSQRTQYSYVTRVQLSINNNRSNTIIFLKIRKQTSRSHVILYYYIVLKNETIFSARLLLYIIIIII